MLAFATQEPETVAISSVPAGPMPQNPSVEVDVKPEVHEQYVLVSRALQGDQEAFAGIVAQYSSSMLRTAYLIVEDRDVAEDVVQDAFIQAWHHLPDLREAGALRPWLMRIVVNQCISFKRRVARSSAFMRQALSEQETDMLAQVADHFKGRMERDWDLAHAIKNLPARQRVAIVLHYYNGMTLPEMAHTLHISENTLKKRIQAALANLRQVLRSEGGETAFPRHALPRFATSVALSPAG
ncbi:MAG: RNA polymerase sigma factor [Chloroflexota bacterium]|nr:RNA polymerase sigma factor [Chloroflexota bacterium]